MRHLLLLPVCLTLLACNVTQPRQAVEPTELNATATEGARPLELSGGVATGTVSIQNFAVFSSGMFRVIPSACNNGTSLLLGEHVIVTLNGEFRFRTFGGATYNAQTCSGLIAAQGQLPNSGLLGVYHGGSVEATASGPTLGTVGSYPEGQYRSTVTAPVGSQVTIDGLYGSCPRVWRWRVGSTVIPATGPLTITVGNVTSVRADWIACENPPAR